MLFNSVNFLIFFPIVLIIYFCIPSQKRYIWLLIASYYFYMCWNAKYVVLLLFSTIATYLCAYIIDRMRKKESKTNGNVICQKVCIFVCILLNLMILFFFKYFDFAISNLNNLLNILGLKVKVPVIDVVLPIGISFYIFQALGYILDVYRGEIEAERNFLKYALFVSFFPQLVAGPIERSKNLLNQIKTPTYFDIQNIRNGLMTMAYGLFLKVVVADNLASIINPIYENYNESSGMMLLTATIFFAFQIYCDFEGYSQLAIGSARVLGFHISGNFKTPYLSLSVKEFWQRWHISLTSWFRDYLYIPLGGNRKGKKRKYLNTMIVFLISGLWHGAAWNFVVWGGINGIYNIIQEITENIRIKIYNIFKIDTNACAWRIFSCIMTFVLIDISWLFFRASGAKDALEILGKIISDVDITYFFSDSFLDVFGSVKKFEIIFFSLLAMFLIDWLRNKCIDIKGLIFRQQIVFRWIIYFFIIFIIMFWGAYGLDYEQTQFIYFQF